MQFQHHEYSYIESTATDASSPGVPVEISPSTRDQQQLTNFEANTAVATEVHGAGQDSGDGEGHSMNDDTCQNGDGFNFDITYEQL